MDESGNNASNQNHSPDLCCNSGNSSSYVRSKLESCNFSYSFGRIFEHSYKFNPISDTTIMTCSTTGCDIIDHIKTQFPYVFTIAVVSFVMYIVAGFVM